MNGMENCCGGMSTWMVLIGTLVVITLVLLIIWLFKQIRKA
jgi:flagellar biogenesis protein FliO